jgi:pyruvate,water dikinase
MKNFKYIRDFSQIDKDDIKLVGGKGANLGEMVQAGLPVPSGFALTAPAYFYFLKHNDLQKQIAASLKLLDRNEPTSLEITAKKIQRLITQAEVPQDIVKEVFLAYEQLGGILRQALVAVRSSATAEDLPGASFAGQQITYLNVKGEATLIEKIRLCWASLFTPRAIFYRAEKKFSHLTTGISVIVQKMIQSQTSGVMFTTNPVNNDKKTLVIEAIWGLGELIVQGEVSPDHYEIERSSLKIIKKVVVKQEKKLIKVGKKTKEVKIAKKEQQKQKLSDKLITQLATLGKKIHQHYFFPQDIEWATEKGKIYIIQTRPITTLENLKPQVSSPKTKEESLGKLELIIKGEPASPGIAAGYVKIIKSPKHIDKIKNGEILVTTMTTPDFVPAMRKVAAIITDKGGQTSHAAIVSRELGVPCVVGTSKGTRILKNGQVVTVNAQTGEVFKGAVIKKVQTLNSQNGLNKPVISEEDARALKTATKLYVNLAEPELAAQVAGKNVDGVGLLRAEFMIANIGVHPKKMIADGKKGVYINRLAEDLEKFCRAFSPRPVVYRATDFKSSEYRNLVGGKSYEPREANPMLGFRGAYRYIADESVFSLELAAIKKVRNKLNLKNLWLMIPFVRTVEEMIKVKKIIASEGLLRTPSFKLWMMTEIPSNVILLDEFIKIGIDGVSIGSNDLTMLLLGLDRDNEEVAQEFDERNPAVLWALEKIISGCKKHHVTCSICGQAPSRYPDLTEKLVSWGITSVSVTPDMINTTREIIYQAEQRLVNKKEHGSS